jgi:outer membrane protein assembly factor BamB
MQMPKNKSKLSTIVLVLTLTIAALITAFPAVKAQTIAANAFLAVNPNPTGVNQQVSIIVWCQPITPYNSIPAPMIGYTVTITNPNGNIDTLGPMDSWPMGAAFFTYTPTMVGEYTLKFNYPGQTFESGEVYLPAESPTTTLVVQEEKIPDWPAAELPTDYWERPINAENRDWSSIAGNWLMCYYNSTYTGFGDATAGYNPYSKAPRSSHIVWTKPLTSGGLVGGELGTVSYYSGISYNVRLTPPIIMNGKLYYNIEQSKWGHLRYETTPGFVCVDLRTGEELWRNDEGGVDAGQPYMSYVAVGAGVRGFLWDLTGDTWNVYDAFDGKLMFTFENATHGTDWWWEDPVVFGKDGTMYVYILDGYANSLIMWNSTKAFEGAGLIRVGSEGLERFYTNERVTADWEKGIEWNVTIPDRNVGWYTPYSIFGISDGVAIAKSGSSSNEVVYDLAYNITTGEEIWNHDKANAVQTFFSVTGEGVFASFDMPERRWTGYDIKTGTKLWQSDQNEYPWGTYIGYAPAIAYGKLYSGSFDGYLHAFDITTGKQLWKFYSGDSGKETVYGHWAMWDGPIIADGVVFVGTGEETPTQPLTRGNKVFAIDAETGAEIWNITGYMSLRAIADGYLLGYNNYDSKAYCFGKGLTETTVTGPEAVQPLGTPVLIKGTVTDQSPGETCLGIPAAGTPAISDDDMSAWMEYLYMQQPCPMNVNGVPVKLEAFGSDGSYIEIGTVTSDAYGDFKFEWTAPDQGLYTIMATFEGSDSYWRSYDATGLLVGPAAAPSGPIQPEPTEAPIITTEMAIILAAIIVAVAVLAGFFILRKRK